MITDQEFSPARGSGARWYAVQTQPRREALALQHLKNQQFDAFCPLRRGLEQVGRHKSMGLLPLFPGYVFTRLDLERQRWRSVNGTIGVLRIVSFGERGSRPTALPDGLIEHLQALSAETGEIKFRDELAPGDAVRIVGGPFDQLCGTLESAGELERVTILLDILSKATRVQVSRGMLIAA